jgi:hypothetical protein
LRGGYSKAAHLARLDGGEQRPGGVEHGIDPPRDQVGHAAGRDASVGKMRYRFTRALTPVNDHGCRVTPERDVAEKKADTPASQPFFNRDNSSLRQGREPAGKLSEPFAEFDNAGAVAVLVTVGGRLFPTTRGTRAGRAAHGVRSREVHSYQSE